MAEPTYYVFDGYNLMRAAAIESRDELVDRLAGFVALRGARGVVVFDGVGEDRELGPLDVRFAEHADDLVERIAAERRGRRARRGRLIGRRDSRDGRPLGRAAFVQLVRTRAGGGAPAAAEPGRTLEGRGRARSRDAREARALATRPLGLGLEDLRLEAERRRVHEEQPGRLVARIRVPEQLTAGHDPGIARLELVLSSDSVSIRSRPESR